MRNAKKTLSLVMIAIFTTFIVLSGFPVSAKTMSVSPAAKAQTTRATYYVVKAEAAAGAYSAAVAHNQYLVAVKEVRALHAFGAQVQAAYSGLETRVINLNKLIAKLAKTEVSADVAAAEALVSKAEDLTNTDTYDLVGVDTDLANAQNAVTDALEGIVKLDKDSAEYKGFMARVDAANAKIIAAMDAIQAQADADAQTAAVAAAEKAVAAVEAAPIATEADVMAGVQLAQDAVTAVAAVTDQATADAFNARLKVVADKAAAILAPAKVVSVSAVDGTISVTFDKPLKTTPAAVDYMVTRTVTSATAVTTMVTPSAVTSNGALVVTLTVPTIPQDVTTSQAVAYSVAYGTQTAVAAATV